MKFKLSLLTLSLVGASFGVLQVLANQSSLASLQLKQVDKVNATSTSCTSTSSSQAICKSTSTNQSDPPSTEQSSPAASQNEQTKEAVRLLDRDDGSSSPLVQSSPSNSFSDRPATSSQGQSNPSPRLDLPSMQGTQSDSNIEGLENEQSTPSSSDRTNEVEPSPSGANDRSNPSNSSNSPSSDRASDSGSAIEQQVHEQINQYRAQKGLSELALNENISEQARMHSQNMASGAVAFSHDGFGQRVRAISQEIPNRSSAENVAYNAGYGDPATQAVQGWIDSPGHRQNIEGNYNLTGIGVAQNAKGEYYFTQIFIRSSNTQQ